MNKKQYTAPAMEVTEMEISNMLCVSGGVSEGGNFDKEEDEDLSKARGTYGDLW